MRECLLRRAIIQILGIAIIPLICFVTSPVFAADTCSSRFSWLPYENSNGYRIYYGTTEGGPYDSFADVGNPAAVNGRIYDEVNGLTCGKTYYFVCTSVSSQGDESNYSSEEVVITPIDSLRIVAN